MVSMVFDIGDGLLGVRYGRRNVSEEEEDMVLDGFYMDMCPLKIYLYYVKAH